MTRYLIRMDVMEQLGVARPYSILPIEFVDGKSECTSMWESCRVGGS